MDDHDPVPIPRTNDSSHSNNSVSCEVNTTEIQLFMANSQHLKTGILVSYLVTMCVGLLGNALVIYVIARNAQIRNKSVANYYIWNLAFADLFFIMTMPLFCYATYYNNWPFGTSMCKVSRVFFETNRYASMFTLVALSFDRYLASFYNMGHLRTIKAGLTVCFSVWLLCGTISIPYWMHSGVTKHGQCMTDYSGFLTFWVFFEFAIALVVPLFLICLSYVLLGARLQMILSNSTTKATSVQKPSKKMIRTVAVVVVIFVICQVPWHAQKIQAWRTHLKYYNNSCVPSLYEVKVAVYLNAISTILVFISSCCNPIVYGILNDNYRKQYMSVLCCCCYKQVTSRRGRPSYTGRNWLRCFADCLRLKPSEKLACQHQSMSAESQDGTMYAVGEETENIEMDDQSLNGK